MKTAIVTLVRNEKFFLPHWLAYYGRAGVDLFVLDHESDDGSTDNLPEGVTRIPVQHPEAERAMWMLRTVQGCLHGLLDCGYNRVGYAEVDEFLVPDPARWPDLRSFLESNNDDAIAAQGWNVVHHADATPTAPLLANRYWKRSPIYDMTLLAGFVPKWKIGRHGMEDRPNGSDVGLRLVHLHYLDRELGWERIQARQRNKPAAPDGMGFQNKPSSRQAFDQHWDEQCAGGEPIPEQYWNAL